MIKTKVITTYKDGIPYEEIVQEEVSCKPNLADSDILSASIIMGIIKFASEYEVRLEDPSFYCDIEDIEIEKDEINTDYNIFPKQLEPLIVKNKSHLETRYFGTKSSTRRIFDTKYRRIL